MLLPVTLCSAAAAGILTIWLMLRIGSIRTKESIFHGDGENVVLGRRMRAQLNFVESAPFVLALIAAIELAGAGQRWLPFVAGIYFIGRIAHAIGMDADTNSMARFAGTIITLLTLVGLAVMAVLITLGIVS